MSHKRYYLVQGSTIVFLQPDAYIVPLDDFQPMPSTYDLFDAADNEYMTIIPVIEHFESPEALEGDDLPDFDTVEAAGLDGTLRSRGGVPYTWEDVARAALEELERAGR